MPANRAFTDGQVAYIAALRDQEWEWDRIAGQFFREYGVKRSAESVRHAYRNWWVNETDDTKTKVQLLKETARAKRNAAEAKARTKATIEYLNFQDDLMERIEDLVKGVKLPKLTRAKSQRRSTKKRNMTMELLVSDVHVGKETETFNHTVCIERMQQLVRSTVGEIERNQLTYNVDRLILGLLGDLIENFEMHGLESARGCEFGNAEQVEKAIALLFYDLLVPLAATGIPITAVCVAGNHDREGEQKTFHDVGKTYLTWVIYNVLEMLCREAKITNVEFKIATGPYIVEKVYGNNILFEHGDLSKANTYVALEALRAKRQSQLNLVVHFMRIGHWHFETVFGRGKIVVNGSVPGQDSYADANGFDSQAVQMLVEYIETDTRPSCFFRAFPIYLD